MTFIDIDNTIINGDQIKMIKLYGGYKDDSYINIIFVDNTSEKFQTGNQSKAIFDYINNETSRIIHCVCNKCNGDNDYDSGN